MSAAALTTMLLSGDASIDARAGTQDLAAAYNFDARSGVSLEDASGNGHTGAISGATWTDGRTGGALSFDGVDDWVTIADADALDLTDGMTLEAWVQPRGGSTRWKTVVTKEMTGNLTYGLFSNSDVNGSAGVVTIGGGQIQSIARGRTQLAENAWTHLATTFDGNTIRLYANGAEIMTQAASGSMVASSGPLRIGGNAVWPEWFAGKIDDLRIYSRALSADEVRADMATPVVAADTTPPPTPTGLTVTSRTPDSVTVTWSPSPETGVTYGRYRDGSSSGDGAGTAHTFAGLACARSYSFAVDAVDGAGNRSSRTSVTASTQACPTAPPPASGASGPVAAYAFEETGSSVTDHSGNGNVGTIRGAARTTGRSGNALSFDGVDDWVTIADSPSVSLTGPFTLEAWVRPSGNVSNWRTIVTKETSGNLTYGLFSSSDANRPAGILTIGGGDRQTIVRGSATVGAGSWTHLAATYDGSNQRLYVNGAEVASVPASGSIADSSAPLRLGGNAVWAEWFSGALDDVRIYARALSQTQIRADMNTPVAVGSNPPPPPPAPAPAPDTQAPTAPGNVRVTAATTTSLALAWNASTDNVGVVGYGYFRNGGDAGNGTGYSTTFGGLTCGTSYVLGVDAYDAAGNRSARPTVTASTSPCATTPPPAPPSGSNANLWVDSNGGSCTRAGSAAAYSDGAACGSLNAAYQAAANGDTIRVRGGTYPAQTVAQKNGAAAPGIAILAASGERPSFPDLNIKGSHVRIAGFRTNDLSVDSSGNSSANKPVKNVVVEDFIADGQGRVAGVAYLRGASDVTFRQGDIGNNRNVSLIMTDQDAGAGGLNRITFDRMKIHDALLDAGSSAHTECLYAQGINDLRITNSHFYRCAVMDVFITRWTGTSVDAKGGFVENSIFEAPLSAGNTCCASHAFHFRNGSEPAPDIEGWTFRNNVFAGTLSLGDGGNVIRGEGVSVVGNTFLGSSSCRSGARYSYNVHGDGSHCGGSGETASSSASIRSGYVRYVGSTASDNDWRLTATSVLIDKGDRGNHPASDLDGKARYTGSAPDAGPFER